MQHNGMLGKRSLVHLRKRTELAADNLEVLLHFYAGRKQNEKSILKKRKRIITEINRQIFVKITVIQACLYVDCFYAPC